MDAKSKILFYIMLIVVLLSISALYYKSVVLQDFEIIIESGDLETNESEVSNL